MLNPIPATAGGAPLAGTVVAATFVAAAAFWIGLDLLARRCEADSLWRRLLKCSRLSIATTVLVAGLSWWLLAATAQQLQSELPRASHQAREVLITLAFVWILLRWKAVLRQDILAIRARGLDRNRSRISAIDLINKLLTGLTILIAGIKALEVLGVSPQVLYTSTGLGAAAVGFGARILVENLLSGAMIYVNRPFSIGDYISIPALNLSGTVAEIGAYYTMLVTHDRQPLYMPNASFSINAVINGKRRTHRLLTLDFCLRHDDSPAVRAITEALRLQLKRMAGVAQDLPQRVHFIAFGEASLHLRLECYCSDDLDATLDLQQDLLLTIAAVVQSHGAAMPFPTRFVVAPTSGSDAVAG